MTSRGFLSPARPANCQGEDWANSGGRRNTSSMEVFVGTMRERQRAVQLYRGQIPSPGRPTVAWQD